MQKLIDWVQAVPAVVRYAIVFLLALWLGGVFRSCSLAKISPAQVAASLTAGVGASTSVPVAVDVTEATKYDTVYIERTRVVAREVEGRIRVTGATTSVIDRSDSVPDTVIARAFTAQGDTVIGADTIAVAYHFPQNAFSIDLRRSLDSMIIPTRTVFIDRVITRDPSFWEKAGYISIGVGGGLIGGYILGTR